MMDLFKTLQTLTETAGPSGREANVAATIVELWQPLADEVRQDHMGNVIALKRGHGAGDHPRLLLAAHMDEIALLVKQLVSYPEEDDSSDPAQLSGFLRVTNVGGVDVRHLYGQRVVVHGRRALPGILGGLPTHLLPGDRPERPHNFDELTVDVGLSLAELRDVVSVGDFVSFHQPLRRLLNERVTGKALDNRASVAALTVCLGVLQERQHAWDVMFVATIQEETRLLGAFTSAYAEQPDLAVAIDVTFGKGPGAKDGNVFELADGPTLGLGPNVHPGVYQALQEAARALEMKVHADPHTRASGTDAFGLQIARAGIPTGLVSIPLRYMHTMVETVALKDVKRSGRLLGEFAARLDAGFVDKLARDMMEAD
jgi:tetrahedral aminopeptidase